MGRNRIMMILTLALAVAAGGAWGAAPGPQPVRHELTYATINGRELKLDLVVPENASKPVPLAIHIHGGGWLKGDKNNAGFIGKPLFLLGFAVASVQYRLTSQAGQWGGAPVTFPAQLHDIKGAVRWLRANASRWGLDPKRFCVYGESAGGHLAALLVATAGSAELEGTVGGNAGVSSQVQAGVDYFGPADFINFAADVVSPPGCKIPIDTPDGIFSQLIGYDRPGQGLADIKRHLDDPNPPYPELRRLLGLVSPVAQVKPGLAPLFIAHGTKDDLVPLKQSERLAARMRAAGNRVELVVTPGAGHDDPGPQTNAAALMFLCDVLYPEGKAILIRSIRENLAKTKK